MNAETENKLNAVYELQKIFFKALDLPRNERRSIQEPIKNEIDLLTVEIKEMLSKKNNDELFQLSQEWYTVIGDTSSTDDLARYEIYELIYSILKTKM